MKKSYCAPSKTSKSIQTSKKSFQPKGSERPGSYMKKDHGFFGHYVVNQYKARPIDSVGGYK